MKPIVPLGPRDRGEAVANLQEALLLLIQRHSILVSVDELNLRGKLKDEQTTQRFGDATARAVALCREQYSQRFDLDRGEIVDEPTADALNRLLQEIGAFDVPQAEWVVRGQVVDASGPLNEIEVSVFDRDLFFRREGVNTAQRLGSEITKKRTASGEDGWFEVAYTTAGFSAGDDAGNGTTAPDLVFALNRDGQPLEDFQIFRRADDPHISQETLVSDDDLILGIQARSVEEVRIVIAGGQAKRGTSEYERLIDAIERLLPERAPAGSSVAQREALVGTAVQRFDEETHRDISFVARETGFDPAQIKTLAAAFRLAIGPFENEVPASVFYGLTRTRGASDVLSLGRLSRGDMRSALLKATESTPPLIPPFESTDHLKDAVRIIRDVLARILPTYRSEVGAPSLADLVGPDLPDPQDQANLWRTYSDHVGTPAEFWEKLKSQPGFEDPNKITKLQYSFQLGRLAQNNISLVNAVRARHPNAANTGDLAFDLDTPEKWIALLDDPERSITIPEDVPGKPEDRKANYAASLAGAIQIAHPTAAVATMVASLPPTELANVQPAVAEFLTEAVRSANLDLVAGRIDDLVREHGERLFANIEGDHTVVIDQVKRLQRLFRLSTGPESMKVLLDAGFNSARELAELPPEIAMEMLSPKLGETTARLMLNRARNISAAAVHQYVFLNDAINGQTPGGAI